MTNSELSREKIHYICQTYIEKKAGRDGQIDLKIAKQFEYSTASEAQNRAEREVLSEDCAGADAYMVSEERRHNRKPSIQLTWKKLSRRKNSQKLSSGKLLEKLPRGKSNFLTGLRMGLG